MENEKYIAKKGDWIMENEKYIAKKGDWIMFMSAGQAVIGEVLHTEKKNDFANSISYYTTAGMTQSYIQVRMAVEEVKFTPDSKLN